VRLNCFIEQDLVGNGLTDVAITYYFLRNIFTQYFLLHVYFEWSALYELWLSTQERLKVLQPKIE